MDSEQYNNDNADLAEVLPPTMMQTRRETQDDPQKREDQAAEIDTTVIAHDHEVLKDSINKLQI